MKSEKRKECGARLQRGKRLVFRGNSTDARSKNGDRIPPPPRGGWRGHGWDVHDWETASGRGRDGGSTAGCRCGKHGLARATSNSCSWRMEHAEAGIDGHPQYSPRRPFHPLRIRCPGTLFLRAAPPSRRGADACARSILRIPPRHPGSTISIHQSGLSYSVAPRTFPDHKVARKRDPPGALSSGRDALPRVHSGKWLMRKRLETTLFLKPLQMPRRNKSFPMIGKKVSNGWKTFFQWLEKTGKFSNDWKKFSGVFQ